MCAVLCACIRYTHGPVPGVWYSGTVVQVDDARRASTGRQPSPWPLSSPTPSPPPSPSPTPTPNPHPHPHPHSQLQVDGTRRASTGCDAAAVPAEHRRLDCLTGRARCDLHGGRARALAPRLELSSTPLALLSPRSRVSSTPLVLLSPRSRVSSCSLTRLFARSPSWEVRRVDVDRRIRLTRHIQRWPEL